MNIAPTAMRRWILALSATIVAALALPASAAAPIAYDQAAFEAAQQAGKPILVAISAPWCPICKTQKPIIERLGTEAKFQNLAIFTVDFDTQREIVRRFEARSQSTLIAFKGRTELGRSVGETQSEWIETFLERTL